MSENIEMSKVSINLDENRDFIEKTFFIPNNFDFIVRDFEMTYENGTLKGFLVFYDGLVNQNYINRDIMRGLLQKGGMLPKQAELSDEIFRKVLTLGPLTKEYDLEKVVEMITFGHCVIFVDGCDCCFAADVKGWGNRGVNEPMREASLTGPQEAFNEVIMSNLALVRKILKDPDLIAESIRVGSISQTPCALLYIKGVTNRDIVSEIRDRLNNIETDYIFSSGDIEMLTETHSMLPLPSALKTERPDRAAAMLAEGKAVIIVQGSPFAIVLPTTAADLIEASEDNYVRAPEANFMRLIRLLGLGLSLLLPGVFLAVILFHNEILPTDLLLAIEASREKVPFPLAAELIMMELAFELIKEASVRVPSGVGSTLGIIGGLILGQAAVDANIVSPISIIIVSVAGLGTFAAPSVSLSRALALTKFIFIVAGATAGMLGVFFVLVVGTAYLSSLSTYGVPFLSPLAPRNGDSPMAGVLIKPIWKRERRPANLKTENPVRQPKISRKWLR